MNFKERFAHLSSYTLTTAKWLLCALIVGGICGAAGVVFHYCVEYATEFRQSHTYLLFALPLAGVVIVFLYSIFHMQNSRGTDAVISAARASERVPIVIAPLIIITTALTHLCGGSAGREGAALQIGGSIGSNMGVLFKIKAEELCIMTMCGMSAVFSAVFGTPLTAAVFSVEVASVGEMHYTALFPCIISSITAFSIARLAGVGATSFAIASFPTLNILDLGRVVLAAALCALLSAIFVFLMHNASHYSAKLIPNPYLKILCGAALIIIISLLLRTNDYNGVGMDVIARAINDGEAHPLAFLFKLILTVITLSSGFKGGEIVPSFFIG